MNSMHTSPPRKGKRGTYTRAIILLVCLAAIGAAGIVLQQGRWKSESTGEPTGTRRFAGRTGNFVPVSPNTRQSKNAQYLSTSQINADGTITGAKIVMDEGIPRTVRDIMRQQAAAPVRQTVRMKPEREIERDEKKARPGAPEVAQWPVPDKGQQSPTRINAPQTTGLSFDGPTLTDTLAFPPDTMGAVGPTQFVAFENGRIRTYTKAGVADGVINADPDVFFSSVMTPVVSPVVLNFTSDPNVRYDRFTKRWFMTLIDVPCTNNTCTTTAANRLMIAVSDAASNGTITAGTVWTFFQFVGDAGTNFLDYPSLGVDVNALYIGGNMFSSAGVFVGCNAYVVQKSSILGAGPGVATAFANIVFGGGAGPGSPRGVDNLDSGATEGYFVGPDNAAFSLIVFRRVSNPGSASPTLSANISLAVPATTAPNPVEHLGNTSGGNGRLDSLDDRMYAAMIRNGRMWSAHNFRVNSSGVANTGTEARNAVRWYEFQNLTTTPTLRQSGTVFDNAATRAAARQYFIPSVAVSGQGHAVLGFTMAGFVGATPAYVGRLSGDTLGTMDGPPTTAAVTFGTSAAGYNPSNDSGGATGRRWGDYSYTSLDPLDDMTLWTIQEYNHVANSYAVRVAKLLAPPPAALSTASPSSITVGQASVNVTITGTSSGGSGFYDPGTNLPAPALAFNHIAASVTGGVTVNSVTYTDPTHITLNISTVGASTGAKNVTVTNPDGQSVTANNFLTVAASCTTITGTVGGGGTICAGGSTNVTVTVSGGTAPYTVTLTNGGGTQTGNGPTFTFPVSPASSTTYAVAAGSQDTNSCAITGSGSASVNVTAQPTTANAGPDQTVCTTAPATLAANTPTTGTGAWSVVTGPSTSTSQFNSTTNPAATFTPAGGAGVYTLRWTISNAPCTASTDDVVITFNAPPTTANAGPDQTLCTTTSAATLAANTPATGTGAWSVVTGPSTSTSQFNSTANPAATFTPAGGAGVYTLRWTISNSPCTASTDDVVITFNAAPTAANAGPDQTLCTTSPATLAANTPSVGTGAWSVVTGPSTSTGQFNSTGNPMATFTPAGGAGVYTLRWTISNSPCTASTDDVVITYNAAPTAANAGPDQTLCTTSPASLAANTPSVGTGAWSVVTGPSTSTGQFNSTTNPAATFTPAGGAGVYTLRWTISNSPCTASTDDVVITFNAAPTAANAGPDQTACATSPATLAANTPSVGTGAWSVVTGPSLSTGQFNSTANPAATFTPAGGA
ncbi:MAG TPA: hypothetical protein PLD20_32210, partial [Blastocatellia bacterium]|nr:hypothetical protein [Blastocatellia bacterium]